MSINSYGRKKEAAFDHLFIVWKYCEGNPPILNTSAIILLKRRAFCFASHFPNWAELAVPAKFQNPKSWRGVPASRIINSETVFSNSVILFAFYYFFSPNWAIKFPENEPLYSPPRYLRN